MAGADAAIAIEPPARPGPTIISRIVSPVPDTRAG